MPLPPTELPPTANEASRAATGQVFLSLKEIPYKKLLKDLNAEQGIPKGVGTRAVTLRAIPEWEDVPKVSGDALFAVPVRFDGKVLKMVKAQEITKAQKDAKAGRDPLKSALDIPSPPH